MAVFVVGVAGVGLMFNREFSAFEANPNHHRKPRELCGVLRERVVHCTFLGENGGQYQ